MEKPSPGLVVAALLAASSSIADAAAAHDTLKPVFSSHLLINGIATTVSGRRFLPVQPEAVGQDPQVIELRDGKPVPYPDAAWNASQPGQDGRSRFVGVNALRVGPDGALWVVDRGASGIGKPLVPGGVKLVRIDLAADTVARVYDLGGVTGPKSFVDDVRFKGRTAYLTDAGQPGLIVLDLDSGHGRRVLDRNPSTMARTKLMAEGREVRDPTGTPVVIHADQLEVSPDGTWLYYQPASGIMSRIATRFLDDASLSPSQRESHVERFVDTPSTGGTVIDGNGTIYLSDTNASRIIKITPGGTVSTLITDPRLVWVDAMWIDDMGHLLMPAAQLNRTSGLNGGIDAVVQPITLYSLAIGASPVRN